MMEWEKRTGIALERKKKEKENGRNERVYM
jgi:hypothetical protein